MSDSFSLYKVMFQNFDTARAVLAETDDLAFARQVMLHAYDKLGIPTRDTPEPVIALYEDKALDGNEELLETVGWTNEV